MPDMRKRTAFFAILGSSNFFLQINQKVPALIADCSTSKVVKRMVRQN